MCVKKKGKQSSRIEADFDEAADGAKEYRVGACLPCKRLCLLASSNFRSLTALFFSATRLLCHFIFFTQHSSRSCTFSQCLRAFACALPATSTSASARPDSTDFSSIPRPFHPTPETDEVAHSKRSLRCQRFSYRMLRTLCAQFTLLLSRFFDIFEGCLAQLPVFITFCLVQRPVFHEVCSTQYRLLK